MIRGENMKDSLKSVKAKIPNKSGAGLIYIDDDELCHIDGDLYLTGTPVGSHIIRVNQDGQEDANNTTGAWMSMVYASSPVANVWFNILNFDCWSDHKLAKMEVFLCFISLNH